MINQAMFQRNGRAGYILKPDALRSPDLDLISKRTQHFLDVTVNQFTLQVCCARPLLNVLHDRLFLHSSFNLPVTREELKS